LEAKLTNLLCRKIIVTKSKEVKTRSNLAESSKEGYGSESAVLLLMITFIKHSITTKQNSTLHAFCTHNPFFPSYPCFTFLNEDKERHRRHHVTNYTMP
jgi:hypothetical protein